MITEFSTLHLETDTQLEGKTRQGSHGARPEWAGCTAAAFPLAYGAASHESVDFKFQSLECIWKTHLTINFQGPGLLDIASRNPRRYFQKRRSAHV